MTVTSFTVLQFSVTMNCESVTCVVCVFHLVWYVDKTGVVVRRLAIILLVTSCFNTPKKFFEDYWHKLAAALQWFTAGGAIRIGVRQLSQTWKLRHYDVINDIITRKLQEIEKNGDHLAPWNPLSYPMVKTALLYNNFCNTGNYVIYDVIIWVQDGNCKKWLERILVLVHCTI